MTMETELERFVQDTLGRRSGTKSIGPEDDLVDGGIIDSMALMELVAFLEQRFDVSIDDDDLVIDNFRNVRSIERLVEGKRSAAR